MTDIKQITCSNVKATPSFTAERFTQHPEQWAAEIWAAVMLSETILRLSETLWIIQCGCYLSHLLQVRPEVFPGDVGEVEGGHNLCLCEVQPPCFGEKVGLPFGEPWVVQCGGEVDLRAVHRPPVVLRHHGRAVTQAPPLTCKTRRKTSLTSCNACDSLAETKVLRWLVHRQKINLQQLRSINSVTLSHLSRKNSKHILFPASQI